MLQAFRSILFDIFFYGFTFFYLIIFLPFLILLPPSFTVWLFRTWSRILSFVLKKLVGLTYKVEGSIDWSKGPYIFASKHQSAWETIFCSLYLRNFQIVLKKQLMSVPIYNWYLKRLDSIVVDRESGSHALKSLLQEGRRAIQKGNSLFIFPEGTRREVGSRGGYQSGIAALYRNLNVPVIPIALNSGVFWGRRKLIKKRGTITLRFLNPIPPGLSRSDFMHRLASEIDDACTQIPDA